MNNDPISDLLTRIRNGYMARKNSIECSHSGIKEDILKILSREKMLGKIGIRKDGLKKTLTAELVYEDKKPLIRGIERISSPGRKVYVKAGSVPKVLGGLGNTIISTPLGVMTGTDAGKNKTGGELICKYW